jgi:hypothetical protein
MDEPSLSVATPDGGSPGHVAAGLPEALDAEAPDDAPPLDESPEVDEPKGPDRTMYWVIGGAVLVAAFVFLCIVVGQKLVNGSVQQQMDQLAGVKVSAQLTAAGRAMDLYRASTGAYPTDVASLRDVGYTPQDGVTIQVVPIVGPDYCLAGGPSGEAPTSWYTGTTGLTQTPCA